MLKQKSMKSINNKNEELNILVKNIGILEPANISSKDNLTSAERTALFDLIYNNEIIIKPADKGSSIVIMNTDYYRDKLVMEGKLNNSSYKKVDNNSDTLLVNKLEEFVNKHSTCLTKNELEYLKNDVWKTSEFYVLPKVHKCKSNLGSYSQL